MTDEQIFKLAKTCEFDEFPDDITATKKQLLKFARAIYEKGRDDESELYVDENY
jgi:hypothetical protein